MAEIVVEPEIKDIWPKSQAGIVNSEQITGQHSTKHNHVATRETAYMLLFHKDGELVKKQLSLPLCPNG